MCVRVFFFLALNHYKLELYKKLDLSHDRFVAHEPQASMKSQTFCFFQVRERKIFTKILQLHTQCAMRKYLGYDDQNSELI